MTKLNEEEKELLRTIKLLDTCENDGMVGVRIIRDANGNKGLETHWKKGTYVIDEVKQEFNGLEENRYYTLEELGLEE